MLNTKLKKSIQYKRWYRLNHIMLSKGRSLNTGKKYKQVNQESKSKRERQITGPSREENYKQTKSGKDKEARRSRSFYVHEHVNEFKLSSRREAKKTNSILHEIRNMRVKLSTLVLHHGRKRKENT